MIPTTKLLRDTCEAVYAEVIGRVILAGIDGSHPVDNGKQEAPSEKYFRRAGAVNGRLRKRRREGAPKKALGVGRGKVAYYVGHEGNSTGAERTILDNRPGA